MALDKTDVVDILLLSRDKTKVLMVVYDGGEIPDPGEREQALQKKLRTYLEFVASGQFIETYPEHADRGVGVTVVCLHPPTAAMKQIEGIRDHERPESFLPVEVMTDAEFRASIAMPKPPATKPWWRFW